MKPTIVRNRQIFQAANHTKSRQLGATLSKELREKYGARNTRVIKGDTVHVMRGEFKGIDGKVTRVSTEKNSVAVEGIKREKLKGGNIDIFIHTSNVMITDMNLDDKWRQNRLAGQATKTPTEKPKEESKEKPKPQEKVKTIKEKPKAEKETPKEKTVKSEEKKRKQTKAVKPAKKENK
ncbi:MAG TPA: 50S ribosomal protein L24 [Nitrosopumilaceae archaeon]|nr:50S ribosomal protein L24 [Nitrosopumilaceae archaeon]